MDKNKKWINDIENNELKKLPKNNILLYKMPQSTNKKILDIIKDSKSVSKKNKTEIRDSFHFPKLIKFSFAAACLLIIVFFTYIIFYQKGIPSIFIKNKLLAKSILTTGNVNKIKRSTIKKLTAGDLIENRDTVKTDVGTKSIIQLGDRALVLLKENTEIQFLKITDKKNAAINISLKKGMVIFTVNKLEKKSRFKVTVNDININVIGTQFLVHFTSDKSILIAALTGKIEINSKKNNKLNKFTLNENNLLLVKNNKITEKKLPTDILKYFEDIQNINKVDLNNYSTIKIINKEDNIDLYLNQKVMLNFNKNIELILSSGKYLLELKQDGILIYKEEFNINPNEKQIKEIIINQNNLINKKENPILQWKSKYIYQAKNNNESQKNKIIGFAHSKNRIIALSQSSIICFDINGKLIWKKIYGEKRSIYFMSTPIIYQGKVFVSSLNKKLIILDLKSGKELKVLDSPGDITFGYTILPYKNKLFLPYINGIYILQANDLLIEDNVFIPFDSPTKPLLYNNKIFLSSFITKQIGCYNLEGKEIWNFFLNNPSFNSPVVFKNAIFNIDKSGIIYKISLNGKLIKKTKLPAEVISNINPGTEYLYTLANNGNVYQINYNTLHFKELFKADNKFDDYIYLFKKPIEYDNKLLIGNDKGKIIIYDLSKNIIINKLKTTNKSISTPIYQISSVSFFAGTEEGKIFIIK